MIEPTDSSIHIIDTCQTSDSKWDNAILIAEKEARSLALKLARIRHAIKVFRANKRDGVQWPGDTAEMSKADTSASEG